MISVSQAVTLKVCASSIPVKTRGLSRLTRIEFNESLEGGSEEDVITNTENNENTGEQNSGQEEKQTG
jgi:hypothetical protein